MRTRWTTAALAAVLSLAGASGAQAAVSATDVADSSVSALTSVPRGSQPVMAVSATERAFLRFSVSGLNGIPVQRAVLRLWATDGTISQTQIRSTSNTWSESTITSQNAPATGGTLTTAAQAPAGRWTDYDVTAGVTGDGQVSFIVAGAALDAARFAARENGAATAPQLVVTAMTPVQEMGAYVSDPAHATAHRYRAVDDRGVSLDGLKAIAAPSGGGYLGVSHAMVGGVFRSQVVTSTDLMNWRHVRDIADHASQPTISTLADGSLVVAYERDVPDGDPTVVNRSSLVIQRYASTAALVGGAGPVQEIAPARTLSAWSEGTPSIRSASPTQLVVDFHYLSADASGRQYVDRQATGTLTNFTTWSASAFPSLDAQFDALGVHGNLGDRDDATFRGAPVALFEGQGTRGDFSTWRLYRYDRATSGPPVQLAMTTEGASQSFGNPTVSVLTAPSGRPAIFATAYVFGELSGPGESGEMLLLREVP
jgi:hypothetical protein